MNTSQPPASPLLIIHESARNGGAERALLRLLDVLKRDGADVDLLLLDTGGELEGQFAAHHPLKACDSLLRFIYNHTGRCPRLRRWLLGMRIKRTALRKHYGTLISFMEGPALLTHTLLAPRADINLGWVHCDMQRHHWSGFAFASAAAERAAYLRLDGVACVSESVQSAFLRWLGEKIPTEVVPNLLPLAQLADSRARRKEPPHDAATPRIGWVGRLMPEKNPLLAVEVIAALERRHGVRAELIVVGDGPLREALQSKAEECGVAQRTILKGYAPNPYPTMVECDAMLSTSPSEGSPLVLAEALLLGVPMVAGANAAAEEWLGDDRGWLAPLAADALADALAEVLANPKESMRRALRGRAYAQQVADPAHALCALKRLAATPSQSEIL